MENTDFDKLQGQIESDAGGACIGGTYSKKVFKLRATMTSTVCDVK